MGIETRVTPHKPWVPLYTLPEDERDLELYRRLHVDQTSELKQWNEKYGYHRKYELDKPLTWLQHLVLDGIWWRVKLWFKKNLP